MLLVFFIPTLLQVLIHVLIGLLTRMVVHLHSMTRQHVLPLVAVQVVGIVLFMLQMTPVKMFQQETNIVDAIIMRVSI